ncbi:M28 family peptidase [Sphingomicrobium clamense]|uniref:M20/M25/M40 family metallo-hydrolase n=1 Tax=Sphingomicrobium clamense TaxID=2851013 RepID=A0ABS6V4A6_9SPHN|nr:M28 family peptidase [Sphingomicrobium sp. B8]MBW0144185.1 M20/M25/M40 family metallo-hydrolase [Sphingomicrobium sp. B8]
MTKTLLKLTTAIVVMATAPAYAQENPVETRQYRAHAEFLADDLLEGRESGTPGYDIAAIYVANQFRAMGVAPGDLDGDYMQDIPFARFELDENADNYLTIDGVRYDHGDQVIVGRNPASELPAEEVELVFVGQGLYAPEYGIDSFGDVDLTGKIAVTAFSRGVNNPNIPSDVGAHLGSTMGDNVEARGAVGTLTVLPAAMLERFTWDRVKRFAGGGRTDWAHPDGTPNAGNVGLAARATLNGDLRDALFEGSPMSWAEIEAKMMAGEPVPAFSLGKTARVVAQATVEPQFTSANVVGMIEGSDPDLKDELIVMTAHLDHVGIEEDAKPGEDNVYNGLFDNALGVSAVLELARLFAEAETKPRRSIAFVLLAAEEKGLLGSDWLAKNPDQFPGKTMVANINIDMPIHTGDFDSVVAHGAEHSNIGRQIDKALADFSVRRVDDPAPEEVFFVRSDHYSFVKAGIPSVNLDPLPLPDEQDVYDDFLENRYHKVGDQLGQPLDWDAAAKFAWMNYLITRSMTDDDQKPMWYADSFFGRSTAPDAEKATR